MSKNRTNAPESLNLDVEETALFDAARAAVVTLKKTFETWVVIGRAVVAARKRANRIGGGKTFRRILEQQGLGVVAPPATATRLERIMAKLPEIETWRAGLTENEAFQWASPSAVFKHCPALVRTPDDRPADHAAKPDKLVPVKTGGDYDEIARELARNFAGTGWHDVRKMSSKARVAVGAVDAALGLLGDAVERGGDRRLIKGAADDVLFAAGLTKKAAKTYSEAEVDKLKREHAAALQDQRDFYGRQLADKDAEIERLTAELAQFKGAGGARDKPEPTQKARKRKKRPPSFNRTVKEMIGDALYNAAAAEEETGESPPK
jgi:hypothetical protein